MAEITLSNEELEMLSDCILSAMQSINQAQRLMPTGKFNRIIREYESRLSELNTKICESMRPLRITSVV